MTATTGPHAANVNIDLPLPCRVPGLPRPFDRTPRYSGQRSLWLRWTGTVLAVACALTLAAAALDGQWGAVRVARWIAAAAVVAACELAILARGLDRNRRTPEGPLLTTLGLPNALTLLRGLLVAGATGFVLVEPPAGALAWGPGGLYIAAVTLDAADGAAARRLDRVTELGAYLDVEFDSLALLAAALVGVAWGTLPPWYLLAGVARYAFVGGAKLRRRRGLPVHDLPESARRRVLAVVQMAVVGAALSPVLRPPATTVVATVALVPLLAGFWLDWRTLRGVGR